MRGKQGGRLNRKGSNQSKIGREGSVRLVGRDTGRVWQ